MKKKYYQIAEIIKSRIENGSYSDGTIPGLRVLGNELGVSYLTVRSALHLLCSQGLLEASNNKNFKIIQNKSKEYDLRIAALSPLGGSNDMLNKVLKSVMLNYNVLIKQFHYTNRNDETIPNALDGDFDLIFFLIEPDNFPLLLENKFKNNKHKLVSVTFDYRKLGIRLIAEADIKKSVEMLLKVLKTGHRKLDIIAATHSNEIIKARLDIAELYAEKYKFKHNTYNKTVPGFDYEIDYAGALAFEIYKDKRPDAIFVPTVPAAMGVKRKLKDLGYQAGKDYSLVSCEDYHIAANCIPSITITYTPDITPFIKELIDNHRNDNIEKLLYKVDSPELFIGESICKSCRLNDNACNT